MEKPTNEEITLAIYNSTLGSLFHKYRMYKLPYDTTIKSSKLLALKKDKIIPANFRIGKNGGLYITIDDKDCQLPAWGFTNTTKINGYQIIHLEVTNISLILEDTNRLIKQYSSALKNAKARLASINTLKTDYPEYFI